MSTIEQVKAAEKKVNEAQAALRAYVERPAGANADIGLHRRLAEELKQATDEYVRPIADLDV